MLFKETSYSISGGPGYMEPSNKSFCLLSSSTTEEFCFQNKNANNPQIYIFFFTKDCAVFSYLFLQLASLAQ